MADDYEGKHTYRGLKASDITLLREPEKQFFPPRMIVSPPPSSFIISCIISLLRKVLVSGFLSSVFQCQTLQYFTGENRDMLIKTLLLTPRIRTQSKPPVICCWVPITTWRCTIFTESSMAHLPLVEAAEG